MLRWIGRFLLYVMASLGILAVLVVAGSIVLFDQIAVSKPDPLPERFVLRLDLSDGVADEPESDAFTLLTEDTPILLTDLVQVLDRAAADSRVKGLMVEVSEAPVTLGVAQEIRAGIDRFRDSGKFVYAFAETMGGLGNGTLEFYIASAAGEIWLQPSGDVGLIGVGLELPFLSGLFELMEVQPKLQQRHEYKSAAEMFTRAALSDPARESLQRMVDSSLRQIVEDIADARGMSAEQVRMLVDHGPFLAEMARTEGLIDRLGYFDEFEVQVDAAAGGTVDRIPVDEYLARAGEAVEEGATQVALIYGVGPIVLNKDEGIGGGGQFGAIAVADAIAEAIEDPDISAILFRVDSPGGDYVASDLVWREVMRAREAGKPVIVSMGGYAASGGYFVAMAADTIVASPGTLTGSIGVFGGKVVTRQFWEKLGITWDEVHAGERALMWSPIFDYPEGGEARVSAALDAIYADFTSKVARARSLGDEEIKAAARGRVWTGADAFEHGLVDLLGGFGTAVQAVKAALSLAPDAGIAFKVLPEPTSPLEQIWTSVSGGTVMALAERALGVAADGAQPLAAPLSELAKMRPVGVLQLPYMRLVH